MPAHGLVSGVAVDDLTSAIVKACKDSGLILGGEIVDRDSGDETMGRHASLSHGATAPEGLRSKTHPTTLSLIHI